MGRYGETSATLAVTRNRARIHTVDTTVPTYDFWDKLRRGKASGYTLGGLFAARIERIFAAWVLGGGFEVTLAKGEDAYTNAALADFVAQLLDAGTDDEEDEAPDREEAAGSLLLSLYRDALGLGDQFVIVNADGSLSVPSPDTVEVDRDPLDYRLLTAVRVVTKTQEATIEDEYRADGRTVTITRYGVGNATPRPTVLRYPNLLGRIPVVHVAFGRSGNETNGHPVCEALRALFDVYDDVAYKQIDGARLLGNPTRAITGLKNPREAYNLNKPSTEDTYTDKDGNTATRAQINWDENAMLLLGEGGDAKFVAPPTGFTADTAQALKTLFLLLLDHTGIPEFIWGNEVASGRSSSETQMEQFVKDVQGHRRDAGGWIVRLCRIWLQTRALVDPRMRVGKLQIAWPPVLNEDMALMLEKVKYAHPAGLIPDETALAALDMVEDAAAEVAAGRAEADARRAQFEADAAGPEFRRRLAADLDDEEDESEGE